MKKKRNGISMRHSQQRSTTTKTTACIAKAWMTKASGPKWDRISRTWGTRAAATMMITTKFTIIVYTSLNHGERPAVLLSELVLPGGGRVESGMTETTEPRKNRK